MTQQQIAQCPVCRNAKQGKIRAFCQSAGITRFQCDECESIFIYDPPLTQSIYDKEYNLEFTRPCDVQKAGIMARKIGELLQGNFTPARILEIGAGNGLTAFLLQQLGHNVEVLDVDAGNAKHLQKKLNLPSFAGEIQDLNSTAQYDLIYAGHVIEHIRDPHKFLRGIFKNLDSGGILYIDTPCVNTIHYQYADWKHFKTRDPFEHLILYSQRGLCDLLKNEGFDILQAEIFEEYKSMQIVAGKE